MSFKLFRAAVERISAKYGLTIYEIKHAGGQHHARLSNGYWITANTTNPSITFKNRNHCIMTDFKSLNLV